LKISAARLIEHPLDRAIEQRRVRQLGEAAIKPQVYAGDRRMFKAVQIQIKFTDHRRHTLEGQGGDIEIRRVLLALRHNATYGSAFDDHSIHRRAQMQSHVPHSFPGIGGIQVAQRNRRDAHLVRVRPSQEALPEYLEPVTRRHALQVFVHGADQHLVPEAADGRFGLALFAEPLEYGDPIQVRTLLPLAPDGQKPACNPDFV